MIKARKVIGYHRALQKEKILLELELTEKREKIKDLKEGVDPGRMRNTETGHILNEVHQLEAMMTMINDSKKGGKVIEIL